MSQNLQNFVKFQKFQLENLVDFEKCCKTHIFLQKSEPIQPKTSNILPKFCQPTLSDVAAADGAAVLEGLRVVAVRAGLPVLPSATRRPIGKISAKCCSFSAVSAPIFARKYAFCSIFQNLPDYQAEIFEIWKNFANEMMQNLQILPTFKNLR